MYHSIARISSLFLEIRRNVSLQNCYATRGKKKSMKRYSMYCDTWDRFKEEEKLIRKCVLSNFIFKLQPLFSFNNPRLLGSVEAARNGYPLSKIIVYVSEYHSLLLYDLQEVNCCPCVVRIDDHSAPRCSG